jgi:uncharacterized protein YkwD
MRDLDRRPMRVRAPLAALAAALTLVLAGCATAAPAQPAPTGAPAASTWQTEMLASLNAQRSKAGVGPLVDCAALERAAQGHSADQAAHNKMSHTGSDGSSPWDRIRRAGYYYSGAAENVAAGQRSVASVMDAWMGSSGHRANILNATYTHVGMGLAHSTGGTPYWTQNFGRGGTC